MKTYNNHYLGKNVIRKTEFFLIENIENKTVLGATNDGRVIQENAAHDKPGQLWKKTKANQEGYFILENSESLKVLTAFQNQARWREDGNIFLTQAIINSRRLIIQGTYLILQTNIIF